MPEKTVNGAHSRLQIYREGEKVSERKTKKGSEEREKTTASILSPLFQTTDGDRNSLLETLVNLPVSL
jgi:hypothetical protein